MQGFCTAISLDIAMTTSLRDDKDRKNQGRKDQVTLTNQDSVVNNLSSTSHSNHNSMYLLNNFSMAMVPVTTLDHYVETIVLVRHLVKKKNDRDSD